MAAASQMSIPSIQSRVSAEEWRTRVELAACYRLVAHFGWSDLVFTHITARVPGVKDEFLINPNAKVPGTAMIGMVADPQQRADVIAYLSTLKE